MLCVDLEVRLSVAGRTGVSKVGPLVGLALVLPLLAIGPFTVNRSGWAAEPAAKDAGATTPLFDGAGLAGWTVENGAEVVVDDKTILLKGGDGWVRSHHTYGDFELSLEWLALKESEYDAGIYIRTQAGGAPFPKDSHQVNLLEGKEGNIGNIPGAASTGLVRKGEWNAFEIMAVGERVSLKINGQAAYAVEGLKHKAGYIGLQCEVPKGGQFRFRNVRIQELGSKSLFNGRDLAGWEGAGAPAEQCWLVEQELLVCTGDKGPWLRSATEYGDFNLRLEYRLSAGGNSGVYVRVPEDGNHHRDNDTQPPAGFEVQILDDAAEQYKNLKDYQYSAGLYDIAGPSERNTRPAGEWNTLEIDCRGPHVRITHNGVLVVDCPVEKYPLLGFRSTTGFLGLQNHSTRVAFRNIRVRSL